jgi:hypothetical protein
MFDLLTIQNSGGMIEDNPDDRLEVLRGKYELEIREKERELHALKAKLANLIEFAEESEKLGNLTEGTSDKYAHEGLTYAALDAVHSLCKSGKRANQGVSAVEIGNYLLAHGYKNVSSKNVFGISVNVTLKRLAESGKVHRFPVGKKTIIHHEGLRGNDHKLKILGTGGGLASRKIMSHKHKDTPP